jgi:copper resistance protein C
MRRLYAGNAIAAAVVLCLGVTFTASAHAILLDSKPLENAVLSAPDFPVELSFNSRIDPSRSKLNLESSENSNTPLSIETEPKQPSKITARVSGLKPGAYKLRWQVLAVDGHITRGVISFSVR